MEKLEDNKKYMVEAKAVASWLPIAYRLWQHGWSFGLVLTGSLTSDVVLALHFFRVSVFLFIKQIKQRSQTER